MPQQRLVTMATRGGGRELPFSRVASVAQIASPVIANVPLHQTLGVASISQQITIPPLVAAVPQDVPFLVLLSSANGANAFSTIPNSFSVAANSKAILTANVSLSAPPPGVMILSVPVVSINFGAPGGSNSTTLALVPGGTYSAPQVSGSIRAFSAEATTQAMVNLLVQAHLIGIPVTVGP
jgi:hypothetical protein